VREALIPGQGSDGAVCRLRRLGAPGAALRAP
jgi:hypothetical protein